MPAAVPNSEFQKNREIAQTAGVTSGDLAELEQAFPGQRAALGFGEPVHVEVINVTGWDAVGRIVERIAEKGAGLYEVTFGKAQDKQSDIREIKEALLSFQKDGDLAALQQLVGEKSDAAKTVDLNGQTALKVNISALENFSCSDEPVSDALIYRRIKDSIEHDSNLVLVAHQGQEQETIGAMFRAMNGIIENQGVVGDIQEIGKRLRFVVRQELPVAKEKGFDGIEHSPAEMFLGLSADGNVRKQALEHFQQKLRERLETTKGDVPGEEAKLMRLQQELEQQAQKLAGESVEAGLKDPRAHLEALQLSNSTVDNQMNELGGLTISGEFFPNGSSG